MANILVVDDDPDFRITLVAILKNMGHTVEMADSGQVGLNLIKSNAFNVVLLDIIMPEMDGVEVLREIKKIYLDIKIIMMSGGGRMGGARYLNSCKRLGSDYILEKPFLTEELSKALNLTLN